MTTTTPPPPSPPRSFPSRRQSPRGFGQVHTSFRARQPPYRPRTADDPSERFFSNCNGPRSPIEYRHRPLELSSYPRRTGRMPPTIQYFDDQSMHMPPASVLCGGLFYQENHQTSASDRINPSPDIRTNNQWNPCLRNRNSSSYNNKRNTSYTSPLKPDVKRLLDNLPEDSVVTEEHLDVIRKRTALLLVSIQTMTLFHHNQILENKLSALHKRVTQIQKDRKNNNNKSATK